MILICKIFNYPFTLTKFIAHVLLYVKQGLYITFQLVSEGLAEGYFYPHSTLLFPFVYALAVLHSQLYEMLCSFDRQ